MHDASPSPIPFAQVVPGFALVPRNCVRRISPAEGRALEKLAHAIEYLTDELTLECMTARHKAPHPVVAAIELLKRCNREVYLSCPVKPTIRERLRTRIRSWMGRGSEHLPASR